MVCVTTRFQLKRWRDLILIYAIYLQLRRELKAAPGLIRYAFLIQDLSTCFTLSVWESPEASSRFFNTPLHIAGVRRARAKCAHIWSAYWTFGSMSEAAHSWPGSGEWPDTLHISGSIISPGHELWIGPKAGMPQ